MDVYEQLDLTFVARRLMESSEDEYDEKYTILKSPKILNLIYLSRKKFFF